MKRSDMVDEIACILVCNAPYVQAIDIKHIAKLSDLILKEIEDKGMAPPEIEKLTKHYELIDVREWEEE